MSDAQVLLVGGARDTRAVLAKHCPGGDVAVAADGAAALVYLRNRGAGSGALRPRLIVHEPAVDAAAAVAVAMLKADADLGLIPLVVLLKGGDTTVLDACYRAGANACLVKPATTAAVLKAVAALVAFWLGANEVPAAAD